MLVLETEVAKTLASPHPVDLLIYASTLLAGIPSADEPSPFEKRPDDDVDLPSVDELIVMFREAARMPTDALLLVLTRLSGDEMRQRRIAREVAGRRAAHYNRRRRSHVHASSNECCRHLRRE